MPRRNSIKSFEYLTVVQSWGLNGVERKDNVQNSLTPAINLEPSGIIYLGGEVFGEGESKSKDDHFYEDGNHKFIFLCVDMDAFKLPWSESMHEAQDKGSHYTHVSPEYK